MEYNYYSLSDHFPIDVLTGKPIFFLVIVDTRHCLNFWQSKINIMSVINNSLDWTFSDCFIIYCKAKRQKSLCGWWVRHSPYENCILSPTMMENQMGNIVLTRSKLIWYWRLTRVSRRHRAISVRSNSSSCVGAAGAGDEWEVLHWDEKNRNRKNNNISTDLQGLTESSKKIILFSNTA